MKKYLVTSDRYLAMVEHNAYFFNKYWSANEEVTVLCFKKPTFNLPSNFKVHSLGDQLDYGSYWTTALIPFFKSITEDYFLLLHDDGFLTREVDLNTLCEMEELVRKNEVQKAFVDLYSNTHSKTQFKNAKKISEKLVILPKGKYENFRTTLKVSIWNKEHFLKYLKPNFTGWQFEKQNKEMAKKEDAAICVSLGPPVYSTINVIEQGEYNKSLIDARLKIGLLKQEDFEIIERNYSTFEAIDESGNIERTRR